MYIVAGWMNITMLKDVTETIMTKKRGGFWFSAQTAGWLNCGMRTRIHKATNLLVHQVGEVVTVKESNEATTLFLFLDGNCRRFNPLSLAKHLTNGIMSVTLAIRNSFRVRKRLWICWVLVLAKPKETELAGGRRLRPPVGGRAHTDASVCDIWLKKKENNSINIFCTTEMKTALKRLHFLIFFFFSWDTTVIFFWSFIWSFYSHWF